MAQATFTLGAPTVQDVAGDPFYGWRATGGADVSVLSPDGSPRSVDRFSVWARSGFNELSVRGAELSVAWETSRSAVTIARVSDGASVTVPGPDVPGIVRRDTDDPYFWQVVSVALRTLLASGLEQGVTITLDDGEVAGSGTSVLGDGTLSEGGGRRGAVAGTRIRATGDVVEWQPRLYRGRGTPVASEGALGEATGRAAFLARVRGTALRALGDVAEAIPVTRIHIRPVVSVTFVRETSVDINVIIPDVDSAETVVVRTPIEMVFADGSVMVFADGATMVYAEET